MALSAEAVHGVDLDVPAGWSGAPTQDVSGPLPTLRRSCRDERGQCLDGAPMRPTPSDVVTPASPIRRPARALVGQPEQLAGQRADSRISAYVYGDVLMLAATAGVSTSAIRSGEALLVVVGTVLSTYVAHVLADVVGAVFAGHVSRAMLLAEARDSVPVASAGLPSLVLLGAAALGWPPSAWAQGLACAVLIARLGAVGLVYRRFRPETTVRRAVWFGLTVTLVAAVAAALKLTLTH
jgi:hypothetical protein